MASKEALQNNKDVKKNSLKYHLEEMELKIKYLKNDIDFKTAQLESSTLTEKKDTYRSYPSKRNAYATLNQHQLQKKGIDDKFSTVKSEIIKTPAVLPQNTSFCSSNVPTCTTSSLKMSHHKSFSKQRITKNPYSYNVSSIRGSHITTPQVTNHSYISSCNATYNQSSQYLNSPPADNFAMKNVSNKSYSLKKNVSTLDHTTICGTIISKSENISLFSNKSTVLLSSKTTNLEDKSVLPEKSSERVFADPYPHQNVKTVTPAPKVIKNKMNSSNNVIQSRYKLIKSKGEDLPSLPILKGNPSKYMNNRIISHNLNEVDILKVQGEKSSKFCGTFTRECSQRRNKEIQQLKIKTPHKVISKYKLKRLSPSIKFKSSTKLFPVSSINRNLYKLDKRKDRQPVSASSLVRPKKETVQYSDQEFNRIKNSNIKLSSASKIVNKYKLRRCASNVGNLLETQKIPFNSNRNSGLLKLDRRQAKSQSSLKLNGNFSCSNRSPFNRSNRKLLKLDRRPQQQPVINCNNINHYFKKSKPFNFNRDAISPKRTLLWASASFRANNRFSLRMHKKRILFNKKSAMKKHQNKFAWKSQNDMHRGNTNFINVRGNEFQIYKAGRSMRRVNKRIGSDRRLPEFSKFKYKRSRFNSSDKIVDQKTFQAANRVLQKSIAIATSKYRKNFKTKKHCIFFSRFGKCHRAEKCSFIHDPAKVAVCTRFLRGKCEVKNCPFSHKASVHKMPVCLFYLQGSCARENCPYLHVNVNPSAPVCKDFLNGFCAAGEQCKKLHSHVCPSFAAVGSCQNGATCPMLHRQSRNLQTAHSQRLTKSCVKKMNKLRKDLLVEDSVDLEITPNCDSNVHKINLQESSKLTAQPSFISLLKPSMSSDTSKLSVKNSTADKPNASIEKTQKITPSFMFKD